MSQSESTLTSASAPLATRPRRNLFKEVSAAIEGYLYLSPTLIGLILFVFWPIVASFTLSLQRISPFGNRTRFVGLENYIETLTSPDYWETVRVTLLFVLGTVPTGLILAVALAIALAYPLGRIDPLYRTLIFVPVVISSAVTGVLFKWLFHPVVGYINYWMLQLGIIESMQEGPNWFADRTWALVAVIVATTWRQLGFNVIVALAGVQNIDESYYDAAKVDGANAWQRIRHITLPLLSPTLFFLLIINIIYSFQAFGEIDVLTQGGPGRSTTTMVYAIYRIAFVDARDRGLASSQAYLLALMVMLMSYIQFVTVSRRVHYQ